MADLMDELIGGNGHGKGQMEPEEKEAPKILRCPEAERIARDLIQRYHGHLTNATILCLTTSQARKKKGKPVEATTKKTDPLLNHFSEADFIILIDESVKRSISPVLIDIAFFRSFSFSPMARAIRCSHGLYRGLKCSRKRSSPTAFSQ